MRLKITFQVHSSPGCFWVVPSHNFFGMLFRAFFRVFILLLKFKKKKDHSTILTGNQCPSVINFSLIRVTV